MSHQHEKQEAVDVTRLEASGTGVHGTNDVERIEAPVTVKAYFMCAFAVGYL